MNPLQTTRIAARALGRNKTRSFLTALGIIIGVAAVIAMVAFGRGANSQIEASIAAMGSNLLIVTPGSSTSGGARGGSGSQPTLTYDDLKAIQKELSTVRYAAPVLRNNTSVVSEEQNWYTSINGTIPDYFAIRSWPIGQGALFTDADVESGAKLAVLGLTVAEKLFGADSDPVGQVVRIKNIPFQVIGVLAKKGQSPVGQDYDDAVYMPMTAFQTKIQGGLKKYLSGTIYVSAASSDATTRAEGQIRSLLRDRHRLDDRADDDFQVRNLTEMADAQAESGRTFATLLASIAAVSLLVGGIGIMNIMLVSVTERTREIGIRMAVGAKPRDILAQFLVEALVLSVLGGMLGIAIGWSGAYLLAMSRGWPLLVEPSIVILSVTVSGLVGVVFGLYPASKASRLDPIDALRFE